MAENSMLFIFNRANRLLLLVVFCFLGVFVVVVVVVFFSENLKLLFLQLGGGEEMEGIFHLALLCFVNVFVTLKICFLEGKVIKFIVQKGVYLGSKMKLLCLGACLVCLM